MTEIGQLGNVDGLTSDVTYRLGGCLYIPQGLNFAKEMLEDFKASNLFNGQDLENCKKGIGMFLSLMTSTAEKMRDRPPK